MEQTALIDNSNVRFYKKQAIWAGTFLGGPLAAGYFLSQNFKALNEFEKAKKTWNITIFGTIIIFSVVFLLPEDANFPNQLIPVIYSGIAYYLFNKLQGAKVESQVQDGAVYHKWWKVIAVSLIAALALVCLLFLFVLLIPEQYL